MPYEDAYVLCCGRLLGKVRVVVDAFVIEKVKHMLLDNLFQDTDVKHHSCVWVNLNRRQRKRR